MARFAPLWPQVLTTQTTPHAIPLNSALIAPCRWHSTPTPSPSTMPHRMLPPPLVRREETWADLEHEIPNQPARLHCAMSLPLPVSCTLLIPLLSGCLIWSDNFFPPFCIIVWAPLYRADQSATRAPSSSSSLSHRPPPVPAPGEPPSSRMDTPLLILVKLWVHKWMLHFWFWSWYSVELLPPPPPRVLWENIYIQNEFAKA
jgi:hypothetical protein